MPRKYECRFCCGFTRSRKYVVTNHEKVCHEGNLQRVLERMQLVEEQLKDMQKDLISVKAELAKKRCRDATELYNLDWRTDVDDLDTKPDLVKKIWQSVGKHKKDALKYWLEAFFEVTPRFFRIAANDKIVVKGLIGNIDERSFGLNGCEATYTFNTFYNAFIHNMCDVIERSYSDLLYDQGVSRITPELCEKHLRLKHYYRPKRTQYDTDAQFREANRTHKIYKTEAITWLKNFMNKKMQNEATTKCL